MEKEISLHRERLDNPDKERQKKELVARHRALQEDFALTFGTPHGRRVLSHIAKICGFGQTCVGANMQLGMNIKDGTFYNSARQSIYLELRPLIPVKILKPVEYNDQEVLEEIN